MQDLGQRRKAALDFHKDEYYRKNPNAPQHLDLLTDGSGEDELDSGVGMFCSITDDTDCVPSYRTNTVNGSKGLSNGGGLLNSLQNTTLYECDGYDEIDGGYGVGGVDEGELGEDPNGQFECQDCGRKFGATGYVMHVQTCTGK